MPRADIALALKASSIFEGEHDYLAFEDSFDAFDELELTTKGILVAHKRLMKTRSSLPSARQGVVRESFCLVGGRLMPPPKILAEYLEKLEEGLSEMSSDQVADFLVKLHPFDDGNGRLARMVLHKMQEHRGELITPMSGSIARNESTKFQVWVRKHYPEADSKNMERVDDLHLTHPWSLILDSLLPPISE